MNIKPTVYKAPPLGIEMQIVRIEYKSHHMGDYIVYTDNDVPYFITNAEAAIFLAHENAALNKELERITKEANEHISDLHKEIHDLYQKLPEEDKPPPSIKELIIRKTIEKLEEEDKL